MFFLGPQGPGTSCARSARAGQARWMTAGREGDTWRYHDGSGAGSFGFGWSSEIDDGSATEWIVSASRHLRSESA